MISISHMLWFDDKAEEAANFYTSLVPNSKMGHISRNGDGNAFTVEFEIAGNKYVGLNGGPVFTFNESFSIVITCDGQEDVDHYWNALIADGGSEGRCGWLKDKFGLSWQVVPVQLMQCLGNPDPERAQRAMSAMIQMNKLIVAELEAAVA